MTDEERLQLHRTTVDAIKSTSRHRREQIKHGPDMVLHPTPRPARGRSGRAARYSLEHKISLTAAAHRFGVTPPPVYKAFRRLFPGVPAIVGHRDAAATRVHAEDEVSW